MYICIRNLPDTISWHDLKFAAKFFANMLMTSRLCDTIGIIIKFTSTKGCKGLVMQDPDNPRNFLIEIRKSLSRATILQVLAHEMIHVKQYAKGEMKDYVHDSNKVRFRGKIIILKGNSEDDYLTPWEVDSYGMEVGLYHFYKKTIKELNKNDRLKRCKKSRKRS